VISPEIKPQKEMDIEAITDNICFLSGSERLAAIGCCSTTAFPTNLKITPGKKKGIRGNAGEPVPSYESKPFRVGFI
jgi:hypothetical protein